MKTLKIFLEAIKPLKTDSFYACGNCFFVVDFETNFCSFCKAKFSDNNIAYELDELIKYNEANNHSSA